MLAVVKHISKVYNTAAVHNSTDYEQREAGEIPTEKYASERPKASNKLKFLGGTMSFQGRWLQNMEKKDPRVLRRLFLCSRLP